MVKAVTYEFADYIIWAQTETVGTYIRICGLTERGVNRTKNVNSSEVPDCDDETLPASIEKSTQSAEVTISATGVKSAQATEFLLDWWYSDEKKIVRIEHAKAAVGDTQYEEGPALLVNLNESAAKGQKVGNDIEIHFDGLPLRTPRAA